MCNINFKFLLTPLMKKDNDIREGKWGGEL